MGARRISLPDLLPAASLARGLAAIRAELELPTGFPDDARAAAAKNGPMGHLDAAGWLVAGGTRADRRGLPLVTLDPTGSRDLDQAFAIEAGPDGGHTLHYAIADVAAHLDPEGPIARESHRRGETLYLPDGRVPLHPPELSEGSASLLPGLDRLAVVWTLEIDAAGELGRASVERAIVRSREQLDYVTAAEGLAGNQPHPQIAALAQLGPKLQDAARRRGAIELNDPAQELTGSSLSGWSLDWVPRAPVEDWNAQLSLTTGRAAAALMLRGASGLLRTLPPAPPEAEPRLRTAAQALGVDWPAEEPLPERLARLEPAEAAELAFSDQARTLLRGAGYLALVGEAPTAAAALHAAVAAPYAHVTAPLRRLGDRFATEAALAVAAGEPVPRWVADALPSLPAQLTASGRRAGEVGRAVLDLAEAIVLEGRVGETFQAAVVEVTKGTADIRIEDPPIRARAAGEGLVAGEPATVRLTEADPVSRRVRFAGDAV